MNYSDIFCVMFCRRR